MITIYRPFHAGSAPIEPVELCTSEIGVWWFALGEGEPSTDERLRALLSCLLNREVSELRFELGEHGKPRLADARGLHFNVSHSGKWCVIAASFANELGIDVERIDAARPLLRLAERYFSQHEQAALRGLEGDALAQSFFAIWTRKEACIKASGEGVARGLSCFTVPAELDLSQPHTVALPERIDIASACDVELVSLNAPPAYRAALAWLRSDRVE